MPFMLIIYTYEHGITHYNAMFLEKCIDSNKKKQVVRAEQSTDCSKGSCRKCEVPVVSRALPEQLQSEMDFGKGQVFRVERKMWSHSIRQDSSGEAAPKNTPCTRC